MSNATKASGRSGLRQPDMNLKEIKEMIVLMQDNQITELELEREGLKIKLKRGTTGTAVQQYIEPSIRQPAIASTPGLPPPLQPNPAYTEIKSPMVGTYYQSPAPDAGPYVEIGQKIESGQVLCIIEAMKLMNEIKAEIKGTLREILVRNADPVEYGQILFRIEPS